MKIGELSPNPRNPRKISSEKLKALQRTINEFGDLGGFVFNKKTKQLVGGHQRAKIFDSDAQIIIEKTYEPPTKTGTVSEGFIDLKGERFKYREVMWEESREKAANIAANKGAGEWDVSLLKEWFVELNDINFDLDLTMFDEEERKEFIPESGPVEGEDDVPETRIETDIKLGDMFQLGEHRLLCGDSTDKVMVDRLMGSEKADMIFTDPPYGVNFKYNKYDDNISRNEHVDFLKVIIDLALSLSSKLIITPGGKNLEMLCKIRDANHIGCWTKTNALSPGRVTHFWTWEPIFFYGKFSKKRANDVFNFCPGKQTDIGNHPCPKPIALWQDIIENFSEIDEKILDLFGGSGSTLIACEKTKRKCFMLEIDPQYCQVIIDRWEKFTGQKAVVLPDNMSSPSNGKS